MAIPLKLVPIRKKAERDLWFLAAEILGGNRVFYEPFHRRVCEYVSSPRTTPVRQLVLPRKHFKTTIATVADTIRLLLEDPSRWIGLFTLKDEVSLGFMRDIKNHLLRNQRLRQIAPDLCWSGNPKAKSPLWKSTAIILPGNTTDRIPTIYAGTMAKVPVGFHFHHAKIDDPIDEVTVSSKVQLDATTRSWIQIKNVMLPGSYRDYQGTPYHFDDLCMELARGARGEGDYAGTVETMHFGIHVEPGAEEGAYLIPKREGDRVYDFGWDADVERLQRRDGNTAASFAANYLCWPQSGATVYFRETDVMRYDPDVAGPRGARNFFTATDFNTREDTRHDPAVVLTAAVDDEGHIWVVEMFVGHPDIMTMAGWIHSHYERFKPRTIFVEDMGYQRQVKGPLEAIGEKAGITYPTRLLTRHRSARKFERITAMAPLVQQHKLHIPWSMDHLVEQLTRYPDVRNDDMCDALADIAEFGFVPDPVEVKGVDRRVRSPLDDDFVLNEERRSIRLRSRRWNRRTRLSSSHSRW